MHWFKFYHGMPYDPQLAVVSKRAGIGRAEALAVWVALLDHASQNTPRGSAAGFDAEKLCLALDLAPDGVEAALKALSDKGLVDADGMIADWHALQKTSTDRVRAWRARCRPRKRPRPAADDTPAAVAARHARLRGQDGREQRPC